MELIFAYLAGILTLINPCVLPVLPIVIASAFNANSRGPLALAIGLTISFVVFGMFVTTIGHSIGLTQERLSQIGAVLMMIFGLILLVPALSRRFEIATQGVSGAANQRMLGLDLSGFNGQLLGGILLGIVWSPCIGPTLGGAIALASQGESLLWAFFIMLFFAFGVSTLILGLSWGTKSALQKRTNAMKSIAERSKPIMGTVFLCVGLMIFFKIHYILEAWAVDILPYWLQDFSVIL
ncbi:cytochrome c biogenesis CcdA family protein [Lentilitoribacter sp. Alg239-R112]|uniref:cytochrome c biogenesis CcdA family protein n=1 Tax=Lentilitoribacter sp. Alg239-R112 TaxID=2305987 RepID=UPI0013A6AD0B|nr:cytochrome c biogenesis CcdA family protein [Lentilitoribacter sp. Alg239-R112]